MRNAEAAKEITLKRGSYWESFALRALEDREKLELLKLYLEHFVGAVQRYFPIKTGSPPDAFRQLAPHYPVFELLPTSRP